MLESFSAKKHKEFMKAALQQAQIAFEKGEVPVGAVLVSGDEIVSCSYNKRETSGDPTAHAEILALRSASEKKRDFRLDGSTLYVTKEPCPMCAAAIVLSRVKMLVFGAFDSEAGAAGSVYDICEDGRLGRKIEVIGGIMEDECASLLKRFFQEMRTSK
ncbi:MAG: tRNA adenosine(34) deaminase TadA [Actinomycetota bacterium]|nr:tRNA adenosine(34) deaminase TadA [Actinomycetota bacterium]